MILLLAEEGYTMTPERTEKIYGQLVEEFYWNGRMVVYVNNAKTEGTFDEVCDGIKSALDHQFEQSTLHG